ncbi:MAG: ribonuclease HI family protein [Candidatus Dojkabacteria bacterium]|nr:ribonuclease HI family protein [Candidatus Dojkabacteria bacterium]
MYSLYTDGASRGNPGSAAYAFFLFERDRIIYFDGKVIGVQTNNFAEYTALICGINYVLKLQIKNITCFLDSELVVKQINGEYAVKDKNLYGLFNKVNKLKLFFNSINFVHIPREQNFLSDRLVNIILDNAELN